jgi:hypothetical protein
MKNSIPMDADARFFARFPRRRFRGRIASAAEIARLLEVYHEALIAPPGCRWLTVVKRLATGVRGRTFVLDCKAAVEHELTEAAARRLYEQVCGKGRSWPRGLRYVTATTG